MGHPPTGEPGVLLPSRPALSDLRQDGGPSEAAGAFWCNRRSRRRVARLPGLSSSRWRTSPRPPAIRSTCSLARGKAGQRLAGGWQIARSKRPHLAHRTHPFRIQGSGKVYTYKLFVEAAHHLLRDGGRLGMLVPSGHLHRQGRNELRKDVPRAVLVGVVLRIRESARVLPDPPQLQVRAHRRCSAAARRRPSTRRSCATTSRNGSALDEHAVRLAVAEIKRFAPSTLVLHGVQGLARPGVDRPALRRPCSTRTGCSVAWRRVLAGIQHDERRQALRVEASAGTEAVDRPR